jgi:hypothetical protein
MNRMRAPFVSKIVFASVIAVLLCCAPLQLAAQEREPRATDHAAVITWLSGLWNDLIPWLADEVPPPGPEQPTENLDGACSIDPWGICRDNGS